MGDAAKKLIDQALSLPEDEREAIALELMASLGEHEADWHEAWAEEIDRRVAEVQAGTVTLHSWSDAKAALRARLGRG